MIQLFGGLPEQTVMDLAAVLQGIDHIGHNGAGGGQLAGALAIEHNIAQHITLHQHSVKHIVHARQLVGLRHQHRLHTGAERIGCAFSVFMVPGDQLDGAVQLLGSFYILHGHIADAAGGDVIRVNMMPAGQAAQDGDLAAGITAIHIVAGILGFGIAQLLGNFQRGIKAHVFALHLGQHKVGGSVHNALDLADLVCGKALVHGSNDGGTATHAGFKQERCFMLPCKSQQLCAIGGNHLLVGGTHAAAAFQALAHIRISKTGAADGFHNDLDFRIVQDHIDIFHKQRCVRRIRKITHIQDVLDLHRLTRAAGNGCGVAAADFQHTAANGAESHDCNLSHTILPLFLMRLPASGIPFCAPWRRVFTFRFRGALPPQTTDGPAGSAFPQRSSAWFRCAR